MRTKRLLISLCIIACTTKEAARDSTAAASATASSTQSRIRSCGDRLIREDGIGNLKLGMLADSVKAICQVAFDTVRLGPEGMNERVLKIEFPPESVEAEIVNDSVWRLNVTSPGFQTRDSIKVGTPVQQLVQHDDAQGLVGEGNLFVVFRRDCGTSFMLSGGLPAGRVRNWNREALAKLPATTTVRRILLFSCPPAKG